MKQVVIENPILNTPYEEPTRHFEFSDEGITDRIAHSRRISSYFIPIAKARKKADQMSLNEWTEDRIEENTFINNIRGRVEIWRKRNYPGITKTSRKLLEHWKNPKREKRLFFCQIEALETAIYITEAASKYNDAWIENDIRRGNEDANPLLFRIAFKMATGSGKTVVMAMLIAWHVLNKLANPKDARFRDTFLIVTPGITIRDRLRVLLPSDPENYYRKWDIAPTFDLANLGKAKVLITNFHAFRPRERLRAGKVMKAVLNSGEKNPFTESPGEMVRRVCRDLGNKKNIIVINDEAHHCYRRRTEAEEIKLSTEDKREARKRNEYARVWISGLEAIKEKIGVKAIYDLSATPFFLRGSGYPEGTLFPWVVSDFSLIDAIESGIVKIPRVPVSDDQMIGDMPAYRDLWLRIRKKLPRKGRGTDKKASSGEPELPAELEGSIHSLYGNYEKYYEKWEKNSDARDKYQTPPVFIVVCNNTNVSKMVCNYISGWEKELPDGTTVIVPGALPLFNNEKGGRWSPKPFTILIDSEQLDSGEPMSSEFKKMVAAEIEEFKCEYKARFPGRDAENLTDEDLLREVMNTVGKPGKLGEHIRCVVSVSMLTEGWDANTVTHILGIRAFGTQLLCEQVVGRGLRRMSFALNDEGKFNPEYAEVYGVPFSFIPCSGSTVQVKAGAMPTRIRALDERVGCKITFPRLLGYRYDLPDERINAEFTDDSQIILSTLNVPTKVENAPIVGEKSIHTLDELKEHRIQEVAFLLSKLTLERYFRDEDENVKPWLFPQVLAITRRWLDECVVCKDNMFPQVLLLIELAHDAADRIYNSIVKASEGEKILKPILYPYDSTGSTRHVDFDTTKPVYSTRADKCHVSHVVADTGSWEQKMAQVLEDMDEIVCYVKNHNLGFLIPYTIFGAERNYIPDFIAHADIGEELPLNLIIEVTGKRDKEKAAKVSTARTLWVPAVNNHGGFGRWAFIEIRDPWDAMTEIRAFLAGLKENK